ncbi:MAG: CoA pyrophosphatase [Bacteroidales bacterium]
MRNFSEKIDQQQFAEFCNQLGEQLLKPLPGSLSHDKMSSRVRLKELESDYDLSKAIRSSVLILFYLKKNILHTSFILRQSYDGVHSGQVSFPGGRWEDSDGSLVNTALREAREEVNIDPTSVHVIGTLSELYIPPSNFVVLPVVGFTNKQPEFKPDELEVAEIIESDISFLFNPERIKNTIINVRGYQIEAPYFDVNGKIIWGATAMILSELKDIIESLGL